MSHEDNKMTSEDHLEDKVENQIEHLTNDTKDNNSEQTASDKTPKKKCRGGAYVLIFLILISGLVVGGCYLWKELQQTKVELAGVGNNAQAQSVLVTENLTVLDSAIKKLARQQTEQSDLLASLHRDTQGNNEDWAIAEVEYLLIIAMHRLLLEENAITALAAMEAADLRLRNLRDPELLPVRQQLATDMHQLRTVYHADIAGMAIYLAELVDISANLPLKSEMIKTAITSFSADEHQMDGELDADPVWKTIPRLLWQEIKSLVVIKRTDEVSQAVLSPGEEYFLTQNLRLELESARLAVLRADTENLRASVRLIQSWLNQYFNTNDPAVINVMEALNEMQAIELKPVLPDINSSLESLRAYLHDVANADGNKAVSSEEISEGDLAE